MQCHNIAKKQKASYFGMEAPQTADVEGHAQCLVTKEWAKMAKRPDSECEKEKDSAGNRLGDGNRLAVYLVPGTVLPCVSRTHHPALCSSDVPLCRASAARHRTMPPPNGPTAPPPAPARRGQRHVRQLPGQKDCTHAHAGPLA